MIRFFTRHMRIAFFLLATLALVSLAAPARAQQTVSGWTLHGDNEVQIAQNEFALVGHAEIERGDTTLYADEIDYFADEDRATASGNVLLSQGGNRIGADSADFDTKAGFGTFYHAYGIASVQPQTRRNTPAVPGAFVAPQMTGQETDVYFFGDMIEKIGPKKYRITNGGFTTCLQPTPRWNLVAKSIVVNINHYTLLKQMVLNVKGVPLFYLPFMYYPTKEDDRATGFLIPTYGTSSVLGQSIHNAFFWAIDRSQDLTIQHEWFSKMGQGVGGDYRYNWGGGSDGEVSGFMLSPKSGADASGFPTDRSFDVSGSANQMLPGRLRARAQVNYFSDLATHQIFNTNIYVAAANERSYTGNVVGAWRNYSLNGNFARYEDFYSSTDSISRGGTPQITVSRNERPLFIGSQVYFSANGEYAHLTNEVKSTDPTTGALTDTNNGLNRLDFAPTLRYPFKKWPFLTVNSSLAFHDTFYTRSYDRPYDPTAAPPPVVARSLNREYATVQAQITGPVFSRIFDTPGNGYAEKFKHTIEPVFTVSRTTSIDDSLRLRIVNNDNKDYAVGGTTNLAYGLNNHLMAKRKLTATGPAQATEILTLSISQTYYTNTTASQFDTVYQGTTLNRPSNFSPVLVDLRATPSLTTTGEVRAQFDSRTHNMDVLSVTGGYNWGTQLRTSTNWTRSYTEPQPPFVPARTESGNSLSITTNAQTRDNRFGGVYSLLYDFHSSTLQQQNISGFYNAQCCGIAVSYTNRPLIGLPGVTSNHTLSFSITLAGLGSVSPFSGGAGMPGMMGLH